MSSGGGEEAETEVEEEGVMVVDGKGDEGGKSV